MDKRVSVVMTTYNGQKYLREQMDSLREQTMPIDEVIIMDDCSTDHTPDLVSAYIKEYNLKGWNLVQNELNQGWKKNFKSGFDLATGGYIFPCDQDDIWHPDKVEKMVGCMENNPKIELLAANYNTFFSEKDNGSGSKLYASNSKKMKKDESIDLLGIDPKWPYIFWYPQYGNQEDIQRYHDHSRFLKFLPYTPEVLLVKTYIERKQQFLQSLRAEYSNQQVDYSIAEQLDFTAYEAALPNFSNQTQYNSKIEERGSFRKKCKQVAEKIALELSQQLNITVKEVYRYSYKFAVENIPENELNVRALLAQTMKRVR